MDKLLCIGELSEQQKMELETHKALVVDLRMQQSMLTQKLTVTAELLEQKEEELRTLRERLMYDVDFFSFHTFTYTLLSTFIITYLFLLIL